MDNRTDEPGQNQADHFDYDNDPTWKIFRIMSEFVEGFTFLARIQRSVTIFGSARLGEDSPYCQLARQLGGRLAEQGYTVVTGGGPGIMEAGNRGAAEAGGNSVGLNIQLPMEQRINPYVRQSMSFNYFFSRKVMLDFSAEAYVFFPGGYGTLDEFFDLMTLIQTGKIDRRAPVIMLGRAFWQPLTEWLENTLLNQLHTISAEDLKLWTLTDDIEEAMNIIQIGVEQQTVQRVTSQGRSYKTPGDKIKQMTKPMTGLEQ